MAKINRPARTKYSMKWTMNGAISGPLGIALRGIEEPRKIKTIHRATAPHLKKELFIGAPDYQGRKYIIQPAMKPKPTRPKNIFRPKMILSLLSSRIRKEKASETRKEARINIRTWFIFSLLWRYHKH
jgi:hypothetical protein